MVVQQRLARQDAIWYRAASAGPPLAPRLETTMPPSINPLSSSCPSSSLSTMRNIISSRWPLRPSARQGQHPVPSRLNSLSIARSHPPPRGSISTPCPHDLPLTPPAHLPRLHQDSSSLNRRQQRVSSSPRAAKANRHEGTRVYDQHAVHVTRKEEDSLDATLLHVPRQATNLNSDPPSSAHPHRQALR